MPKNTFKSYLTFTRKERRGILALVAIILVLWFVPGLFSFFIKNPPTDPSLIDKAMASWHTDGQERYEEVDKTVQEELGAIPHPVVINAPAAAFDFDPNTLPAEDWLKLGLTERTVRTILHYREKGGHFRSPDDLAKIYGLSAEDRERLMPYVRIAVGKKPTVSQPFALGIHLKKHVFHTIDINNADTTAFISLPGIGSKLAARIIHFREKLGGFFSISQVGETYGLPDSTFQRILPQLVLGSVTLQRINVNTADVNTLKAHPYIRYSIANAIVQYREQHGAFTSATQLQQVALITPEAYEKLTPYITL